MSAEGGSARPVRASAVKQRETIREAFSVSGELPMPAPSTPSHQRAPVVPFTPPRNPNSHKKKEPPVQVPQMPEQLGMAKRRKLTMMPPLDVKEYLDNDGQMGLQQRVGDGPERPCTPELLFLMKEQHAIKQPNGRAAWTSEDIALGIAELYRKLGAHERAAFERQADDLMQRYKEEWRKLNKGGAEGKERGGYATAFQIYDANQRKLFEQQHPGVAPAEVSKRLKKAFDELTPEARRPYMFLAERDRERVRVHRSLWYDKSQTITSGEPYKEKERDWTLFQPQYCVYCGNVLIHTREKACQNCGRMNEAKILGFAIGGHKEGHSLSHKGGAQQPAADESTMVSVD